MIARAHTLAHTHTHRHARTHTLTHTHTQMSMFFMWSVARQRYFVDRVKIIEFLIQIAVECQQLNNFSTLLQVMSALEHGSVQKYKSSWEFVSKTVSNICTVCMCSDLHGRIIFLKVWSIYPLTTWNVLQQSREGNYFSRYYFIDFQLDSEHVSYSICTTLYYL